MLYMGATKLLCRLTKEANKLAKDPRYSESRAIEIKTIRRIARRLRRMIREGV